MKRIFPLLLTLLLSTYLLHADEGMWLLGKMNKPLREEMKAMGLEVPFDKVYSPKHTSLKDAVVSFGGFCSGVIVSDQGLLLTNHHCGLRCVLQHSSVEHDYLQYGFAAPTLGDELPNPELFVRFLVDTKDVTKRVLKAVEDGMTEGERTLMINMKMNEIAAEVSRKDPTLVGEVDAYYGGNEFWLSVYRDYTDVRLVFAPPQSIGKFGWDTDNWMWPRHTGDFCVFRVYAGANNMPADYSPDNVPYRPDYVAPISLDGYKQGSFCMTMGYPGSTDRYLSSFGVEELMTTTNQAMIDVRGIKQEIWKRLMNESDSIRIKYASAYDESSNYWKNSIGTNKAIKELKVLEKKKEEEAALLRWIQATPSERKNLLHLLSSLELNYKGRKVQQHDMAYFMETFLNGADLVKFALMVMNFDAEAEEKQIMSQLREVLTAYTNYDMDVDKEMLTTLLQSYPSFVDASALPAVYDSINANYNGDIKLYVDSLYSRSRLSSLDGFSSVMHGDSTYNVFYDPAVELSMDILTTYFQLNGNMQEASDNIQRDERLLNAAVRRMNSDKQYYPDANSTLRFSFGTVQGYKPSDGVLFNYYTTPMGIFEKMRDHAGDPDFVVSPRLLELFCEGDFGRYADKDGGLMVNFISNNDITGGNSGSAMFNGEAELIGLAFDGNWEAMSGDIAFEPNMQRCIGVDIRYILFIIEKYGKSTRLIDELNIR